jgi:hypothetical protein
MVFVFYTKIIAWNWSKFRVIWLRLQSKTVSVRSGGNITSPSTVSLSLPPSHSQLLLICCNWNSALDLHVMQRMLSACRLLSGAGMWHAWHPIALSEPAAAKVAVSLAAFSENKETVLFLVISFVGLLFSVFQSSAIWVDEKGWKSLSRCGVYEPPTTSKLKSRVN